MCFFLRLFHQSHFLKNRVSIMVSLLHFLQKRPRLLNTRSLLSPQQTQLFPHQKASALRGRRSLAFWHILLIQLRAWVRAASLSSLFTTAPISARILTLPQQAHHAFLCLCSLPSLYCFLLIYLSPSGKKKHNLLLKIRTRIKLYTHTHKFKNKAKYISNYVW